MASITVYKLDTADQLNLFYTYDGKVNLEMIREEMLKRSATLDEKGKINGQGFLNPVISNQGETKVLEAFGTDIINLGNYFDNTFDDNDIITNERQFTFYSKSRIMITEDSDLMLSFENSTEEKIRSKMKALVESLGFEAEVLKMDDALLRKILDDDLFQWAAAKIDRVEKDGDKTTKVSYEIDMADDVNGSDVDEQYREHGHISHIKFELPLNKENAPNSITLSLYNNGHRAYFELKELGEYPLDEFTFLLMKKLREI